jgi:hypothetical protein
MYFALWGLVTDTNYLNCSVRIFRLDKKFKLIRQKIDQIYVFLGNDEIEIL